MKKLRIPNRPAKISDNVFDELFEEISDNWQAKAEALQARRWRALRRAMKEDSYGVR